MTHTEAQVEEYLHDFLSDRRHLVDFHPLIKESMEYAITAYKAELMSQRQQEIQSGGYIKGSAYR